jgi:hypothetical protein
MNEVAISGMACVIAIAVACYAREDRDLTILVALAVAANWLLFAMPWIYAPASLAFIAYDFGIPARQEDGWAVIDLLSLMIVAWRGRDAWWSPIIWSSYLVTLAMHAIAWANGLQYVEYKYVLNAALIIQLAVIFMLGGGGCADRLLSVRADLRRMVRASFARAQS